MKNKKQLIFVSIFFSFVFLGAVFAQESEKKLEKEWITLFDGKTSEGWRQFNGEGLPSGWSVENGALICDGKGGDIIYGKQRFQYFELSLEWKISKEGNSGIFFHVQEGKEYNAGYETGTEFQLLDDLGGIASDNRALNVGANYDMYAPDADNLKVKPANEWNTTKILFTEEKVEFWLNGEKIVSYVPWSEDWHNRRKNSKWIDFPDYGKFKNGYIGLQEHGNKVWFRNIKIKVL